MTKKQLSRAQIIKVIAFIFITVIAIFATVAFLVTRGSHAPSTANYDGDTKASIEGLAVCLPHKNTDGPQTMECAIGIRDDKGIYYSLSDKTDSYEHISNIATGKRYEVTGNLEERSDPKYQSAGIVRVERVTEL